MKNPRQQGQQRLGAVEVEEGAYAAEGNGRGGPVAGCCRGGLRLGLQRLV
jgi:hypothetical protein